MRIDPALIRGRLVMENRALQEFVGIGRLDMLGNRMGIGT